VLDWRETSGLDLLVDLAGDGGEIEAGDLGRSIIELRAVVGIDATRRCVARADDATLDRIAALAEAAAALVGGDVAAMRARDPAAAIREATALLEAPLDD
jgi:hypothetical protein